MKREYLQVLANENLRAANEMVTALAAGIFAGNEGITSEAAGNLALDSAEHILSRISDKDNTSGDDK